MKKFCLLVSVLFSLIPAFAQDRIYWGDQNGPSNMDKIESVNAGDLGSATTVYTEFALNPNGLAYYHANSTYPLFYATSRIYENDLAGNSNELIVPTGQFNRGMAIDYVGKKIYWTNSQNGYIGRADLDGGNKDETFITGLANPWDVEIDPVNQKIYWSETDYPGTNAFIQRADLADGGNIETLVSNVNSQGIAVDPLRGKIYYTVFASGANVYSANLDGTGVTGPVTGLSAIADIDVDVATGMLYMIDYQSNQLTKANPDGSNKSSITASGLFIAYGDVTPPTISSVARQSPSSSSVGEGGTARFRVTFSEPVLNLDATDFQLIGSPTGMVTIDPVSLHSVFDVVVSTISGTGTLELGVASSHDILDFRGNSFDGTVTSAQAFSVISAPAPAITSFDPAFGPDGTSVTITGSNFSATPGENMVTFNGVAATVTTSTATSITTTVPAGATTGPIAVSVYGLTTTSSESFAICTPPPVPAVTREGNVLTSGAGANNQWLKNNVEIAGATNQTLSVTEPGDYIVRVSGDICSSFSAATTVTEGELTPSISGFAPDSGQRGSTVVITGTNFSATPAENTVRFADIAATVTTSTLTSITTTVPATTALGPSTISVTVTGRTAASATGFTILCTPPPKPTISTSGGLLTSSSNADNQWLRNGVEIAGATSKTYTATEPGSYSVKVTSEGCATESDPTTIVGAEESSFSVMNVYPNPSHSRVRIELQSCIEETKAEMYTMTGMRKASIPLTVREGRSEGEIDVEDYPDGMYILVITTGNRVVARKFQKR